MEIAKAYYLVNSSSKAVTVGRTDVQTVLPDVMTVLPMDDIGVVARGDDSQDALVFSVDRQTAMNESVRSHLFPAPESIAGKYPRYDYKVDLWIGDEHGCFTTNPRVKKANSMGITASLSDGCLRTGSWIASSV